MISGEITDAQARFNLNNIWRGGAQIQADINVLRHIFDEAGQDSDLVDTLLDWIDENSDTRPLFGAEDVEYLSAAPPQQPYRAANQPFASVEELRLVRGFDAETVKELRPFVTALPGFTPINVNTASKKVLRALFEPIEDKAFKEFIAGIPYKDVPEVDKKLKELAPDLKLPGGTYGVSSNYFKVNINVEYGRMARATEALIRRPPAGAPAQVLWRTHGISPKTEHAMSADSDRGTTSSENTKFKPSINEGDGDEDEEDK